MDRISGLTLKGPLCVACIRNEEERLPYFLAHHRRLGVSHFLFVVNDSSDGSAAIAAAQPDCSVWTSDGSYKDARFGLDWTLGLLARYGHGHWCLTLDADELLIYPHWDTRPLPALTAQLEAQGRTAFGTLTIDLYPQGHLSAQRAGADPLETLTHFDPAPYRQTPQPDLHVNLFQGGVRDRVFFVADPRRAPTMNKVPLVKWHWRFAYRNSTHSLLPPHRNAVFSLPAPDLMSGALLHTKFLPSIIARSVEEKARRQHFARAASHDAYYDALAADPILWSPTQSQRFEGWRHLIASGHMAAGDWA